MQKIMNCLWFDNNAEEAVNFYVSLFKNSKVTKVTQYGEGMPLPKGTVMTVSFSLDGQEFLALNGGPTFNFTPAVSLIINCKTQEEVDRFWEKLSEGGQKGQCGWLTDRFGLSWQVVPTILGEIMSSADDEKAQSVMEALMQMTKLDIKKLQEAYEHA
jgi:predicted 3-demethylubiquinone-9 3-methyltransferase (glyoxalase superfamily)